MAQFIGRFHPLFVHLPIGILLVALLFDWAVSRGYYQSLKPALKPLYLLGGISAAFSCATGLLLASNGEYEGGIVGQHQWLGILVAALSFAFWGLHHQAFPLTGLWKTVVIIVFAAVISWTGHLGGSMTHGEDYLFIHMPQPVKSWIIGPEKEPIVLENVQEAKVYDEVIVPILDNSCYKCHNDKKQKGKLRLDSREFIEKGGKSGLAIITPGDPKQSEMIRRIRLPERDEEHMPPKKRDELSEAQKQIIEWWIAAGAPYEKQVKEIEQSEPINALLKGLESAHSIDPESSEPLYPLLELNAINPALLASLKENQIVVLPVGRAENALLSVNFVNIDSIEARHFSLLEPVKAHIVWLRCSDSNMNDSLMANLQEFPNLTRLYLDNTEITDSGLKYLQGLNQLKFLNLVNTRTKFTGLSGLQNLPKLEQLFIYRTDMKSGESLELINLLEQVVIDTGGYQVPVLVSDTTRIPES